MSETRNAEVTDRATALAKLKAADEVEKMNAIKAATTTTDDDGYYAQTSNGRWVLRAPIKR